MDTNILIDDTFRNFMRTISLIEKNRIHYNICLVERPDNYNKNVMNYYVFFTQQVGFRESNFLLKWNSGWIQDVIMIGEIDSYDHYIDDLYYDLQADFLKEKLGDKYDDEESYLEKGEDRNRLMRQAEEEYFIYVANRITKFAKYKSNLPSGVKRIEFRDSDSKFMFTHFVDNNITLREKTDRLWQRIKIIEKIDFGYEQLENALKKAKNENAELCIYDGMANCNDESIECNVDVLKIYITQDGEYRVDRRHMY